MYRWFADSEIVKELALTFKALRLSLSESENYVCHVSKQEQNACRQEESQRTCSWNKSPAPPLEQEHEEQIWRLKYRKESFCF